MDYDDLVDQFIVNDQDANENEHEKFEKLEESEKNVNVKDAKDENSPNLQANLISIHMKSLIQARQLNRQTIKLENVKERNKKFEELKRKQFSEMTNMKGFVGNNERRRRLLRATKEKKTRNENSEEQEKEDEELKDMKDVEMEGDQPSSSDSLSSSTAELIPCRLELDYEGYKLSDVLLLPSNPAPTQPEIEVISSQLCQDYDLPGEIFQAAITRCLKDQVEEWDVYQGALEGMKVPYEEIGAVPVRLDIIVGLHRLEDQLEISLDPKDSNTETMKEFVNALRSPDERILPANDYAAFKPLIFHNLLEQLMLWRKAIVFGGFHRDPRSNNLKFHDGDVAVLLNDPPNISSVRRHFAHTNTFTPILSVLTAEELDRIEAGRDRESRRRRRTGPAPSTSATSKKSAATSLSIVNNLTGTVRSPPRTLPTPTSYRGSLHRIQSNNNNLSDDEGSTGGAPRKRGRKAKH